MDESRSDHSIGSPSAGALVWTGLLVLAGLAWLAVARQARSMGDGPGTMGMAFPLFVGMWSAMMAAMMFPAIGPASIGQPARAPRRVGAYREFAGSISFAIGFLVPWAVYGAIAFVALIGTGHLATSSPTAAKWLGVAILAAAGIYQFTPLKDRFLMHCHMRSASGGEERLATDAGRGAVEGLYCVGCCWGFMALFVPLGVMNVVAMVGLAGVIFAEKLLPLPSSRVFARAVGGAFLVLAVIAIVHPSLLTGLHAAAEPMMGGM